MSKHDLLQEEWRDRGRLWLVLAASFIGVVLVLLLALHFLAPLPPRSLTMSTGSPGGAYALYAERYKEILARHGIRVTLKPSSGSVENLRRLKGVDGDADLAFIQGGIANEPEATDIVTLGAMYYEPVWVFLRKDVPASRLSQLRGRKIAVGVSGAGAQLLTLELLNASGFEVSDPNLLAIGGNDAIAGLRNGTVDAMITVNGAEAPIVQTLLHDPNVSLLSFDQAEAYARRFAHLNKLTLPEGAIDLVSDLPVEDIALVAPTANLVARTTLHPALVSLVMQAAQEIHRPPGLFEKSNEFPAARDHSLPQGEEAARFYRSGPPLLQRILPFWAAVLVDRLIWTIVPLLALLIPASRIVPALLRWQIRSRIYRWYGELKFLEEEARRTPDRARVDTLLKRLDDIERLALKRKVPLAYANELYILREHIQLLRGILNQSREAATA
ncbi:TAXI family TRAP transporter solute-binding subunit [Niveibacterium sp. SC-1]|uniref:TAXI family TRAP transporter solute-binding subunit n=1 Tax=Niveibacterium sp. SC-1 TaxID=3135646 RepID=UPI00311DC9C6